jgi:D-alanyl-lipoteichoic acid acyltransferase DltB (MBOAT superfamily)
MLFNSLPFAVFLPVVLCIYYLLNHSAQNRFLLAASLFFYACWDWRFLGLLIPLMLVDFCVASALDRMRESGAPARTRRLVLAISMAANLATLGFFKYFNFFVQGLQSLLAWLGLNTELHTLQIVLPIGISFFTFQSMSYTIDVYRGELKATKSFLDFALFVSFFPHLVAGPIMRAVVLLPQVLRPRATTRQQLFDGLHLIIWGLWKKVFVADSLSPIVNATFAASSPSGFDVITAIYAFAFQIYCDFSGYTDVARGVAKLMGFELGLNFNLPYFARNPQDFWSRWHISLSTWLRNYLYIPLGGNRNGTLATYRNLIITMVLGGLWHGAAWTFLLWGLYQGAMLAVHRFFSLDARPEEKPVSTGLSHWACVIVMFQFTCFGWLLFRAVSLHQILQMTQALTRPLQGFDWERLEQISFYICPVFAIQLFQYCRRDLAFLSMKWLPLEARTACYALLAYFVLFRAAAPQAFIYFQF